jgi:hypothetical protein
LCNGFGQEWCQQGSKAVFFAVSLFQIKLETTADFEKWEGMTSLEIAKQCEFKDIVTVLSSYPTDDRNKMQEGRKSCSWHLSAEIFHLKTQLNDMQERYMEMAAIIDSHTKNLQEVNRFVKGEQKRKFYARKM